MSAVEKIEISYFDDTANRYRVPKSQWRKWSKEQRRVFNYIHSAMIRSPQFFQHPEAASIPRDHWKTTAWNAAWEAAHATAIG